MEEYKCKKGVIMEISGIVAFTTGQVYKRIKPEIWPPDRSIKHCMEDNQANEHFFSPKEFNEHFERVGVVENFAHEQTKEPQTEALNKHNVMESVCLHQNSSFKYGKHGYYKYCDDCGEYVRQTAP